MVLSMFEDCFYTIDVQIFSVWLVLCPKAAKLRWGYQGQGRPGNETGNQVQYELIAVKFAHNYSLRELCTQ